MNENDKGDMLLALTEQERRVLKNLVHLALMERDEFLMTEDVMATLEKIKDKLNP